MLLSILASDAIALPLSPAFPAVELEYILHNAGAGMLLATERYAGKARQLDVDAGLIDVRPKILAGAGGTVELPDSEDSGDSKAGLMLYTSGTTNRPVRLSFYIYIYIYIYVLLTKVERRPPPPVGTPRPSPLSHRGMALLSSGPPPAPPPAAPHPRRGQRHHRACAGRLEH